MMYCLIYILHTDILHTVLTLYLVTNDSAWREWKMAA